MATVVTRLLVIAALIIMPFGMTNAGAMASHSETSTQSAHCPDMGDEDAGADDERGMIDCEGMCSAIPATGEGVTQSRIARMPMATASILHRIPSPFFVITPATRPRFSRISANSVW